MNALNKTLLFANICISAALIGLIIIPGYIKFEHDVMIGDTLGMKPYIRRGQFTIYVHQEGATNSRFLITLRDQPLTFLSTTENQGLENRLVVCIGVTNTLTVAYVASPILKVKNISTLINNRLNVDTNADGICDISHVLCGPAEKGDSPLAVGFSPEYGR
jgi:hypothetical protein